MENKINKTEQQELKNKEFLKKIEDKNISNITFSQESYNTSQNDHHTHENIFYWTMFSRKQKK